MKNINFVTIKANFPHLKENRKSYLLLKGKNKIINPILTNTRLLIHNPNSLLLSPYNNNQSIRLMKSNPSFLFSEKKQILKSSSSDFYITRLPLNYSPKNLKEKKNLSLNTFRTFRTHYSKNNKLSYKSNYILKRKSKKEKNKEREKEKDNNPRLRYLGSLIKFKKTKENLNKNLKKKIIPQEQRKEYFDFVNKRRNILFSPRSTSSYVHEKSSDFFIYSIKKTKFYQLLQPGYLMKSQNQKEEIIEMRDIVSNIDFNTQKMLRQIRNLFSQDFKFNYIRFNDDFYDNFENKINFIEDIYRVPIFKNNLVKVILNKDKTRGFEEWKNINVINNTTWNYLNRLKRKLQKEKDEKSKREKELESKKKEEELYYISKKKRKKTEKETEKDNDGIKESNISQKETDNNKKIIKEEENYNNIMMNIEKEEQIKQGKYEDLYTIEQYFLHKNNCNSKVSIAADKLRYMYFNKNFE